MHNGFDPFKKQQPPRASALSLPPEAPQSWKGYGVSDPSQACPPHPLSALEDCIHALREVLEDALQLTDLAPWIHPPYRAHSFSEHTRSVLSVTAAVNPVANAAGVLLQAANQTVAGYAVPLLEMEAANDYQTVFSFNVPVSSNARVKSWGIAIGNGLPESVVVRVKAPGNSGGEPSPPNPFLTGYQVNEHSPVFLLSSGGQSIDIEVGLRDFAAPIPLLIDFGICGWVFPIDKRVDSRKGTRLRGGYGTNCK